MRVLLLALLLGLCAGSGLAAEGGEDTTGAEILAAPGIDEPPLLEPPTVEEAEERAKVVAKRLRCPVCQALSVADSNSDTARAMYVRIEGFVAEGYTDEQIVDYFTDTYGEWVLLDPEKAGLNVVLWLLPVGFVVVGGVVVALTGRRGGAAEDPEAPAPVVDPADPYRQRLLAELGEAPEAPPPAATPAQGREEEPA